MRNHLAQMDIDLGNVVAEGSDDQQVHRRTLPGDVPEQIETCRVRPVDVFEHDNQDTLAGDLPQEPGDWLEDLDLAPGQRRSIVALENGGDRRVPVGFNV